MQLYIKLLAQRLPMDIPINYQYNLAAAIYRIMQKGDAEYASFLHQQGYGKGFKLFCFSQLYCKFSLSGDRMTLLQPDAQFVASFHLPQALEGFVKGLFVSEKLEIADKKSKAVFAVESVEVLPNALAEYDDAEMISITSIPLSPVVAGIKNARDHYDYLSPGQSLFAESLCYNWRSKIESCYDAETAASALLSIEVLAIKQPFKSRLMTMKANTAAETKVRGWLNLRLRLRAEKRWVDLLLQSGAGLYNAMGCGCIQIETPKPINNGPR